MDRRRDLLADVMDEVLAQLERCQEPGDPEQRRQTENESVDIEVQAAEYGRATVYSSIHTQRLHQR
jgi:hypothetical protein